MAAEIARRLTGFDWAAIAGSLHGSGFALIGPLLTGKEAEVLAVPAPCCTSNPGTD
jgi:hypothetical protein